MISEKRVFVKQILDDYGETIFFYSTFKIVMVVIQNKISTKNQINPDLSGSQSNAISFSDLKHDTE